MKSSLQYYILQCIINVPRIGVWKLPEDILNVFKFVRPQDYIDVLIVAYVIYAGIRLIRETRAMQLVKGILILVIVLLLSSWLQLHMIKYILHNTMQVGFVALLVVFQPELRRALEKMGTSRFGSIFKFEEINSPEAVASSVEQICTAVSSLAKNRIGTLIVIERQTKVGDIVRTGVTINSDISAELLVNIFIPNTPLHDGAVVIRENKIIAASCFLPLTQNSDLNIELGTRHRAALGMSESSDAVVVVVSEETGKISIALAGSLTRNLTVESLSKALIKILIPQPDKKSYRKILLWKGQGK